MKIKLAEKEPVFKADPRLICIMASHLISGLQMKYDRPIAAVMLAREIAWVVETQQHEELNPS